MPKFNVLVQVRETSTIYFRYETMANSAVDAARIAQAKHQGEPSNYACDEHATDVNYTVTDVRADEIMEFAEADLEEDR